MKLIKDFQKSLNLLNAIILVYVKDENINKANEQLDILQELIDYCDNLKQENKKLKEKVEIYKEMIHDELMED